MQTPTTISGLRSVLMSLGYPDVLTGLDTSSPEAKKAVQDQLQMAFEMSPQTFQDKAQHRKACSMVDQFHWNGLVSSSTSALASAVRALQELDALLRHDVPAPAGAKMNVLDFEVESEDEDGLPLSVLVSDDNSDDCACDCSGTCDC